MDVYKLVSVAIASSVWSEAYWLVNMSYVPLWSNDIFIDCCTCTCDKRFFLCQLALNHQIINPGIHITSIVFFAPDCLIKCLPQEDRLFNQANKKEIHNQNCVVYNIHVFSTQCRLRSLVLYILPTWSLLADVVLGLEKVSYQVTENLGAVDICATLNNSDYAVQFPFEVQLSTTESNPGKKWYSYTPTVASTQLFTYDICS